MTGITRREFFRTAGLAAAGGCGLVLDGCSSRASYDVVIKEGTVIDGSGSPARVADIGIAGDSIARIGRIPAAQGKTVIQARGMVACPGFIDVHNHTDTAILVNPRAESSVRQGVTTLVAGQCGDSPFPLSDAMFEESARGLRDEFGLDLTWRDLRGFYERVDRSGTAVNFASFVGQGTVRAAAMGYGSESPRADQLAEMKRLVAAAMADGALGISIGLEYAPGGFSSTEELIEVCRAAAPLRGVLATHMRDEEDTVIEAVEEAVRIARESGLALEISHLKTGYPRNWPKLGAVLERIEAAKAAGLDVFCDRYPYVASATGLSIYLPLWAREGTTDELLHRLADPALQDRLSEAVGGKEKDLGSWENVLVSGVASTKNKSIEGASILESSRRAGKTPYAFIRDLLIEERGEVGIVQFSMSEDNLVRLLGHPLVGVGSDGSALAPYGPLGKGKPHPRSYGTFPRVLGKYVREERVAPLEAMVRKMTSVPAARFGISRRGALKAGNFADIVIFDPDKVRDAATWSDPHRYPEGIPHVLVNGRPVIADGEHTGALPGVVLRKGSPEAS